jgi:excinuclease ABC subunit C
MHTVQRNAEQSLNQHKLRRAGDLTARSTALNEIQDALGLEDAPLRIECYDVSHVQGTDVVASMVVFEDGLARKSEYRRFAVRGDATASSGPQTTAERGPDDTAALAEVLRRRFARMRADRELGQPAPEGELGQTAPDPAGPDDVTAPGSPPGIDPETGRPRRFAYPPNLVVVDGGAPQVAAAAEVLAELGITDVALCGLAKRLEEVWLPGEDYPLVLSRTSEGLYLLQRVRDEAHRFAITYHRQKRSKRMTTSALDGIPGLGETRRKALLRHFGSLRKLRAAEVDEIVAVPGIGRRTAEAVLAALADPSAAPEPAFDALTGEVLDPADESSTEEPV